eukprot:m.280281 g.280281  ORF g.280281 m.280281 type:complete len:1393 (+) comp19398_c0_seq3:236-4414(+)
MIKSLMRSRQQDREEATVLTVPPNPYELFDEEFPGTDAEQNLPTFFDTIPQADVTSQEGTVAAWRPKERKMKTLSVGVVLCLNIGVPPPDVVRPNPCAKLQCWIDPTGMPPLKAIEAIGNKLVEQILKWQPKAKCKQSLDPTLDDLKRVCCSLRRRAKEEPALLYYNGHGVPRPTSNGELWVFNKNYTQYLPVSIYDLQTWIGSPSILVYDCPSAELVIRSFDRFAEQRRAEYGKKVAAGLARVPGLLEPMHDCIQLAACGVNETLPTNPALPADLFTACLTTPIETALRWACVTRRSNLLPSVTVEMLEQIPGQPNDRRTMYGQLNWIFTAVTDTIAWNVLPTEMFHRLFRNDLLLAALFRNFLLAERVMRSVNCNPVCSPPLPKTFDHPLWQAWDFAVDFCLAQLPAILDKKAEFVHSSFFSDQLTAFEVWLGAATNDPRAKPPEQLPIVLQVLLSQHHRLRALQLLDQYLQLGPAAVHSSLSVGIFPYVFKLLGSPAQELRAVLISIWSKILAVDSECKHDLLKSPAPGARRPNAPAGSGDPGCLYFVRTMTQLLDMDLRARCAFTVAVLASGQNRKAQELLLASEFQHIALGEFQNANALYRQWLCLALAKSWEGFPSAKYTAVRLNMTTALVELLVDPSSLVRASAVHALGTLCDTFQHEGLPEQEVLAINIDAVGVELLAVYDDGSHIVRTELAAALGCAAVLHREHFIAAGARVRDEDRSKRGLHGSSSFSSTMTTPAATPTSSLAATPAVTPSEINAPYHGLGGVDLTMANSIKIVKALFNLTSDPHSAVSAAATVLLTNLRLKTPKRHKEREASSSTPRLVPKKLAGQAPSVGSTPVGASPIASSLTEQASMSTSYTPSWIRSRGAGDGGLESESDIRTQGFIRTLNQIAGQLEHTEQQGFMSSDLSPGDIHMALQSQVTGAIAESATVLSVLEQFGYSGSFQFPADPHWLRQLANALAESVSARSIMEQPPVTTVFFDWCCSSFCGWTVPHGDNTHPAQQQDSPDAEDHFVVVPDTSPEDLAEQDEWRAERNTALRHQALKFIDSKANKKLRLGETIFHTPIDEVANLTVCHPYEPQLVLANSASGNICVWDYDNMQQPTAFNNKNRRKSWISAMRLINDHTNPLLAVGTSDGAVHLWSDFATNAPTMTTSWRTVPRMRESKEGSSPGLVLDWEQQSGHLYASGAVPFIQIWDAGSEMRVSCIPTDVSSPITSICVDKTSGHSLLAGYGNGNVRLFDVRMPASKATVQHYEQHKDKVINVHLQKGGGKHLLSASRAGEVLWWDPRFAGQSVRSLTAYSMRKDDGMTAFVVHDYAPLLATATPNQFIKIFNMDGELLNHHKHYNDFLGECVGPNSCLGFHPLRPHLVACSTEPLLSIYAPRRA